MPRSRLPVPKPVKSFSFTSAWSSPSLSLRKTMCGAAGDDDAAIRRRDAVTRRQSVRPHDGFVHDSVAIGVAQELHGAVGFGLGFLFGLLAGLDAAHFEVELAGFVQLVDVILAFDVVAVQFADKAAAFVIPADAGGLVDERFAGEEAD
jgi:hypothetical protein